MRSEATDVAGRAYRWLLDSRWAGGLQSGVEQRPGYSEHPRTSDAGPRRGPSDDAAAEPMARGLRGVQVWSISSCPLCKKLSPFH